MTPERRRLDASRPVVIHLGTAPAAARLAIENVETWPRGRGRPEVHFSTQQPGTRLGAHARALDEGAFLRFVDEIRDLEIDCSLEVGDTQQSVLRACLLLPG